MPTILVWTTTRLKIPNLKHQIINNLGVLERWGVGVMAKGFISFFQYSNTPSLQYSGTDSFKTF
jgi:hypothetical protein